MKQNQSTNKETHLDCQPKRLKNTSLNLVMRRAKEQWEAEGISGPSDKTHVLLARWVAATNLKSSWVRGKCLFNSIKGQFIMCILPGKHKAIADPYICIISRQQQSRKGHWFISEQAQVNLMSVGTEPEDITNSDVPGAWRGTVAFGMLYQLLWVNPTSLSLPFPITMKIFSRGGEMEKTENLILCLCQPNSFQYCK